jgi:glycosyltransferase involved in cell wall biosynthesis
MNFISTKPLITTVIPTYRRPKLLARAIRSVVNQTYPHFEVCVYDNASGDETAAVVAKIAKDDSRVKYHCHSHNIGGIQNFNYGMRQVTTPYFSLLADDNTLLPHFFEEALKALNRFPEAILFAGQTIFVNEKEQRLGGALDHWRPGLISPPNGLVQMWEKSLNWEGVLFNAEAIRSVGWLNPSVGGSADQDFLMRLARRHVMYISNQPCALFFCHNNSWSINRDLREHITSNKKILQRWLEDEELSGTIKARMQQRWEIFVKKTISNHLCVKSIFGDNKDTIRIASELMHKEVGLAYIPLRAILLARLANYNRLLKRLLATAIYWYLHLKHELIFLKNRKKYKVQQCLTIILS